MIAQAIEIILHLNLYLGVWVDQYHQWVYALLFLTLFCEAGLVIMPFLPGDSLLFAAGSVFAASTLSIHTLFLLSLVAVFLGDNTNYLIGRWASPKIFSQKHTRWFKQQHFEQAHAFYERHGAYAIIIARFLPIVRTFMPFVAGVSAMPYRRFISISVLAAILWTGSLLYLGYFFGNIPFIKQHFSFILLAIIVISLIPAGCGVLFHLIKKFKSR